MSHVFYCDEETSMAVEKEDLEAEVMSNSTIYTSPEVIDEAELKNVETNRTTMQDTFVGKYKLDGINTQEEMNVSNQMITDKLNRYVTVVDTETVCIDKQSPDIADEYMSTKMILTTVLETRSSCPRIRVMKLETLCLSFN